MYVHLRIVVFLDGVALVEVQADGGLIVGGGAAIVSGDLLLEVMHVGVNVLLLCSTFCFEGQRERKKLFIAW